jgi:hypothetical protein
VKGPDITAIGRIIGKRIAEAVVIERERRNPPFQVFLAFDDGTSFEFYGEIRAAHSVPAESAEVLLERFWRENVTVHRVPDRRARATRRGRHRGPLSRRRRDAS